MKKIAKYADGIGPQYPMLIDKRSTPEHIVLTIMSQEAHNNHLFIHPYTLRKGRLPSFANNMEQLHNIIFEVAKSDGVFTDFPDLTVKYLSTH